jgi:hypothetical protein
VWNLDRGSDRDARAVHVKRAEDFQVPSTPYWQLGIPSEELEKLPRESGVFCAGCSFDSSLRVLCSSVLHLYSLALHRYLGCVACPPSGHLIAWPF